VGNPQIEQLLGLLYFLRPGFGAERLEVVSFDYATIQSDLDRLDFMIVPPPGVAERFDLRGARYCSIQGGGGGTT